MNNYIHTDNIGSKPQTFQAKDLGYKKRIKELESENKKLSKALEKIYSIIEKYKGYSGGSSFKD